LENGVLYQQILDGLNTLASLCIAIATGTLWWSTRNLWKASQIQIKAATGSERPWLFPVATKVPPRGEKVATNNQWYISVTVKNLGRMPALIKECKVKIAEKSTLPPAPDFADAMDIGGPYSVEAQGTFDTRPIGPGKPSDDQLVFYGRITYAELNGEKHTLRFAFEVWKLGMASVHYNNDAYHEFD